MCETLVHSDDKVDHVHRTRYQKLQSWRHEALTHLLDLLDELHIRTQLTSQRQENTIMTVRRGERTEVDDLEKLTQNPPVGFPESMCDGLWLDGVCQATLKELRLSKKSYDLSPLILQLEEQLR